MKKKAKTGLWPDVSILIVTCLAITAFIRGAWQFWLLFAAFAVWCTYAVYNHLLPFLREQRDQKEAKTLRLHYEQDTKKRMFTEVDVSDPVSVVLLRHANHRISSKLRAVYPDATWEWCSEHPERIVAKGGVGRLRLHNAGDYNYGEVILDQEARICFKLLKLVSYEEEANPSNGDNESPKQVQEIDSQVWYETNGKAVLTNLIADLNSRGHRSLTILGDGNVSITQADSEVKRPAFTSIPERIHWPRLIKVFEREGIAAKAADHGLVLSW